MRGPVAWARVKLAMRGQKYAAGLLADAMEAGDTERAAAITAGYVRSRRPAGLEGRTDEHDG